MMMKTRRTTLPWLMAIAIALGSCSKAREEVDSQQPTAPTSPYANTKHEIALDLTPSIGMGDLRAMGMTFDEGLRAVTFDVSGSGLKVQSSTDDWKTYVFFRKKGDNTNVGYATYEYEQGERVTYVENGVTKTKVILRPKDHIITLTGVPSPPAAGEEWYIAGITGGGSFDPSTMSVRFLNSYSSPQSLTTTMLVPFTFDWMPLVFEQRGATLIGVAKPTFKPQGAIIKVSVKNSLSYATGFSDLKFDSENVPIAGLGYFDLSAARYTSGQIESGTSIHWEHNIIPALHEYKMNYGTWNAGETKTFTFWGMPRPGSPKTGLSFSGYSDLLRTRNTVTQKIGAILSEKPIQSGKFYRLSFEVLPTKLPIEYVTERNLAGGPGLTAVDAANSPGTQGPLRFADSDAANQSGYYNVAFVFPSIPYATDVNPSGLSLMEQSVNGKALKEDYFVPGVYNWMAAFPENSDDLRSGTIEYMQLGDDSEARYISFASDYITTAAGIGGVTYACRFRPINSGDTRSYNWKITNNTVYNLAGEHLAESKFRSISTYAIYSAYRYRGTGSQMIIDVIHLGDSERTTTVSTVANDQWWSDRSNRIITRILPYTGMMYPPPTVEHYGQNGTPYMTSSPMHNGLFDLNRFALHVDAEMSQWMYREYLPVRLFTRE